MPHRPVQTGGGGGKHRAAKRLQERTGCIAFACTVMGWAWYTLPGRPAQGEAEHSPVGGSAPAVGGSAGARHQQPPQAPRGGPLTCWSLRQQPRAGQPAQDPREGRHVPCWSTFAALRPPLSGLPASAQLTLTRDQLRTARQGPLGSL